MPKTLAASAHVLTLVHARAQRPLRFTPALPVVAPRHFLCITPSPLPTGTAQTQPPPPPRPPPPRQGSAQLKPWFHKFVTIARDGLRIHDQRLSILTHAFRLRQIIGCTCEPAARKKGESKKLILPCVVCCVWRKWKEVALSRDVSE